MRRSADHRRLMRVLDKMATQERWRKMPKRKGTLLSATTTKGGNLKLVLRGTADAAVYVLKRNKNLFEAASRLKEGAAVSVAVRSYLGKWYCTRIFQKAEKAGKETAEQKMLTERT